MPGQSPTPIHKLGQAPETSPGRIAPYTPYNRSRARIVVYNAALKEPSDLDVLLVGNGDT